MKVTNIKNRSVLFTQSAVDLNSDWDLNIQLIRADHHNYIIDTGLGSDTMDPALNMIRNDTKPTIVILTHHHWDHVWGNGAFKRGMIVSHTLCREMIMQKWDEMLQKNGFYVRGNVELVLPNLTFSTELRFPEDRIRLVHTPGHTTDSICVLDEADRILNVGDNIGDNMQQIIPELTCKRDLYADSLKTYLGMDFDTLISGHNTVCDKAILQKIWELL